MKKGLILILSLLLAFTTAGCKPEVKPEVKPEKEVRHVNLYLPDENYIELVPVEVEIRLGEMDLIEEKIWDALAEHELFTYDCVLQSMVKTDDGKLELDVNSEFGDYVRNMGSTGEYLIIGGIVNTYIDAFDCKAVKITEEGDILQTGHAEYDGYLEKFE